MQTVQIRTEGIKWMIRPGSGDLPVGQFDAQNLLPNGSGRAVDEADLAWGRAPGEVDYLAVERGE